MKKPLIILALIIVLGMVTITVSGHQGRTDSDGGHYDRTTGKYHWHHGASAHQHYDMDGDGDLDCPYDFKETANYEENSKSNDNTTTSEPTESPTETVAPTPDISTILFVVSFVIGLNVLSYFVAFKWTEKKWYFFVSIILTLALLCIAQAS